MRAASACIFSFYGIERRRRGHVRPDTVDAVFRERWVVGDREIGFPRTALRQYNVSPRLKAIPIGRAPDLRDHASFVESAPDDSVFKDCALAGTSRILQPAISLFEIV